MMCIDLLLLNFIETIIGRLIRTPTTLEQRRIDCNAPGAGTGNRLYPYSGLKNEKHVEKIEKSEKKWKIIAPLPYNRGEKLKCNVENGKK